MDEALALPTEQSAHTALRTQQLLAYEHGIGDAIDALGGSYSVEAMSRGLEEEAAAMIEEIDTLGGMVAAIEAGHVQRQIEKAAYAHQLDVESGDRVVVGVNRFEEDGQREAEIAVHEIPEGLEERKAADLDKLRRERSGDAVARALDALSEAAAADGNLVDAIFDAVKVEATLGEVADRLRDAFGEYRESSCLG
jgi:methylmalonyl-CoA mutase N-terminal domain/subunit